MDEGLNRLPPRYQPLSPAYRRLSMLSVEESAMRPHHANLDRQPKLKVVFSLSILDIDIYKEFKETLV
jgi:hypothetical protein